MQPNRRRVNQASHLASRDPISLRLRSEYLAVARHVEQSLDSFIVPISRPFQFTASYIREATKRKPLVSRREECLRTPSPIPMTTDEVPALSVSSQKVEAYIISKRSTLNGEWALSKSSLQDSQPLTAEDALEDYQSASKSSSSERALHARTRQRRRKRCECLEATDHLLPKSDSIPSTPNKRVARSTLEGEEAALPPFDYSITSTSYLSWYETQTECSRAMSPVTTHSSRFSGSQEDEVLVEDEPLSPLSSQSTISISDDDYQKESQVPDDEPSTPLSSQSTVINSDDSSGWEADVEDEGELVYVGALVCRRITKGERLALNMGWS